MTMSIELPASGKLVRVVFDTNVLISAATLGLQATYAFELIKIGQIHHSISEAILAEAAKKLDEKFGFDSMERDRFLHYVRRYSSLVVPRTIVVPALRDPTDLHVVATAVAAKANLIITTDPDLLVLKRFKKIGIIHPKTLRWTFPQSRP